MSARQRTFPGKNFLRPAVRMARAMLADTSKWLKGPQRIKPVGKSKAVTPLARLNEIAGNLQLGYHFGRNHVVHVNNVTFKIPARIADDLEANPDKWFRSRHRGNRIHEPGLVATILFLAERLQKKHVVFFDIGALYGYVSILASHAFSDVEVHCVEANPQSATIIDRIFSHPVLRQHRLTLHTVLLGRESGQKRFAVSGFQFTEVSPDMQGGELLDLEVKSLSDLMGDVVPSGDAVCVLKLDTEGYHAEIVPPAAELLIKSKAILLIEFDGPQKTARFNSSNKAVCEPFLKAGYTLYWLDHRKLGETAIELSFDQMGEAQETNSLGILLPPGLAGH